MVFQRRILDLQAWTQASTPQPFHAKVPFDRSFAYDPSKGTNFHAYAVRRIRGSMIDAFRRMDRLSRTMRQKARDVQRAQSELEVELARTPTDVEAAEHLGVTLSQYREAAANSRWVTVSLDRMLERDDDGDSFPAAEMPTADEDIDFTRNLDERELHEELAEARSQAETAAALARRSFLPGEDGAWVEERRRDLREVLVRALECLRRYFQAQR